MLLTVACCTVDAFHCTVSGTSVWLGCEIIDPYINQLMVATTVSRGLDIGDYRSALFPEVSMYKSVVNVSREIPFSKIIDGSIRKIRYDILDLGHADEQARMTKIFIETSRLLPLLLKDPPVLVHCAEGKQRSAAVITAYLMEQSDLSKYEPMNRLRELHPPAFDHGQFCHFDSALDKWEKSRNTSKNHIDPFDKNLSKHQYGRFEHLEGYGSVGGDNDRLLVPGLEGDAQTVGPG